MADGSRMRFQRCILRNLGSPNRFVLSSSPNLWLVGLFPVRAYVLSSGLNPENLVRAETALNELLDSIPPGDVSTHFPPLLFAPTLHQQKDVANQELHWWKLAVLRRRNASEDALFESEP